MTVRYELLPYDEACEEATHEIGVEYEPKESHRIPVLPVGCIIDMTDDPKQWEVVQVRYFVNWGGDGVHHLTYLVKAH